MRKPKDSLSTRGSIPRTTRHLETNLGIVNGQLGAPVVAEQHFQRALQLQPDFVGGQYFYARWLVEQGRAREAIPHLQRAIELSPGIPRCPHPAHAAVLCPGRSG